MQPTYKIVDGRAGELKPVYFFERANGQYFLTEARDAWNILKGRIQVAGLQTVIPKLVGMSDGQFYAQAVTEAKLVEQEKGLEAASKYIKQKIDEEYQKCKGKPVIPPNFDTVDSRGNPTNI